MVLVEVVMGHVKGGMIGVVLELIPSASSGSRARLNATVRCWVGLKPTGVEGAWPA
jgi:hypothetical protein